MAMLDVTSSVGGLLSLGLYVALAIVLHRVLCSMARNNARAQAAALASAFGKDTTQLELEEEDTTTTNSSATKASTGDYVQASHDGEDDDACSVASSSPNQQQQAKQQSSLSPTLSYEDRIAVTIRVILLLLLHYLLLVYLPGGALASFAGALAVAGLTLAPYLADDLLRHNRWDRIVTLLALITWTAAAATALTYHSLTFSHGAVYAGPARIVGYDTDNYANTDGTTLRANLEVAWGGGDWACPHLECVANVQGALCQAKYNTTESRRQLDEVAGIEYADDDKVKEEEEEFVEEVVDEAEEEVIEYEDEVYEEAEEIVDEVDEEYYEEEAVDEAEVEEVVEEEEELEEEKEELEEENEELEEELKEEEEETEELEEEIEEIEYSYEYEDDYFESDYWDQDWNSVWGEYACEDLFDADLDGLSYNAKVPAGQDDWPTVQIYGTCRSCEAFIMDYYSTEHFLTIQQYLIQAYAYGLMGTFFMIAAAICVRRERLRPSQDTQIILLSEDGGVMA